MSGGYLERAEAAVQGFAERAGLGDDLALDAGGVAALRLGEGPEAVALTLEALADEGRFLVHAVVLRRREKLTLPFAERLLGLALHGVATGGGALGYDPSRGEVMLTLAQGQGEIDAGTVAALVEEAHARALALREMLAGDGGRGSTGEAGAGAGATRGASAGAETGSGASGGAESAGDEAGGAGFSGLTPREQSGPHRVVIPG